MMNLCSVSKKTTKVLLWIFVTLLIVSGTLLISFQSIYDAVLKTYVTLGKGSLVTKIWEDIPLPIYEKLYFFNITNGEAFLNGLEPLNVTEVGPYTFKSRWIKDHPQWNSNHTVSYRERRTYHFVPEQSNGSEDDFIYTLNGPMIMGAKLIPAVARAAFSWYCYIKGEKIVTKKKIKGLVYEGYEDPLIKNAEFFKPNLPYKDGKFAWLYGKNGTDDGIFTVFTGTDDESKTDLINNWNGNEMLSFWDGDTCNMINGTSIETGPPIKGPQEYYTFFQSIFCRSLTFKYSSDSIHFNIPAKRFIPTYSLFANSTENPDNSCFETYDERASGVLDISSCQFDAPVLISFPHFYLADPSYLEFTNGLNPNGEQHGSHIDVEPITGISIDLAVKFQINVELHEVSSIHQFSKITEGIYPVFWVELSLKIDQNLANFLKNRVSDPKIIGYSALGALTAVSFLAVIILVICLYTKREQEEEDRLISSKGSSINFISQVKCNDYKEIKEDVSERNENNCNECKESSEKSAMLHPKDDSKRPRKTSYDSIIIQGGPNDHT